MSYNLALIIHLLCATIFLGFVFADVIVLPAMKKVLDDKQHKKVMDTISARARSIFPVSVLILVLSGGYMFSKYINSQNGAFNSSLQILLLMKTFLAFLIVSGIIYSLSCRFMKVQPNAVMKHFHKFVLITGFFIVILAKLMFMV